MTRRPRSSARRRFGAALLAFAPLTFALLAPSGCSSPPVERTSQTVHLALPGETSPLITPQDVEAHVRALTDERTQGRRAGTAGELVASDYLVRAMRAIGLSPGGEDSGYLSRFAFTAGIALGPDNELVLEAADGTTTPLMLDRDWRPLAFSRSGATPASPVVLAGYGVVAPAGDQTAAIDDYAGLDVKDRWVLVFRDLPTSLGGPRRQELQLYASLRHKSMIARDRGARGVLFVSGPLGQYREELVPLRFDASLAGTHIAVLSISNAVAAHLLGGSTSDLEARQTAAGERFGGEVAKPPESGGRADRNAATPVEPPSTTSPNASSNAATRLAARVDLETLRAEGRNVIGRLQVGPEPSAETIVLGAHFDHLGHGEGIGSLATGDEIGHIHPGADDNASGVAALLEIAQRLAHDRSQGVSLGRRDFVFALWSGEELGLLGSDAWIQAQQDPHSGAAKPVAYLNFDMVGRLRKQLIVQGLGSSAGWAELLDRAATDSSLSILRQQDSYLPTDATSFYTRSIPILSAFTGVHSEYHTPRDTPDLLNYEGAAEIAKLFTRIAIELSQAPDPLVYQATTVPTDGPGRSGFRVYLGTVPDYAQTDIVGVQLSGVAPGGPAAQAGVRGGDVIVEVDGRVIENLYDYTYALEALRIGAPARIVVLRDGKRIPLEVVPASRD